MGAGVDFVGQEPILLVLGRLARDPEISASEEYKPKSGASPKSVT